MTVEAGLAELAQATTYQRLNGNDHSPCVDCGVRAIVMLVQSVTIGRRTASWKVCQRCAVRRAVD